MKTFTDKEGRTWPVAITVDTLKRVKAALNLDLADAANTDLLTVLADDPVMLCDVIYVVCEPEARKRGVSDEAFGQAMGGDVIEDAADALLGALVDFFPKRRRVLLEKARSRLDQLQTLTTELAMKKLDDADLEADLRKRFAEAAQSGAPSTGLPASPA